LGTSTTVYCQVPAHSGPVSMVIRAPAGTKPPARRRTRTTWLPVGRPAQSTANVSGKPVGLDDGGATTVGGAVGRAVEATVGAALVRLGLGTGTPGPGCSSGGVPQPLAAAQRANAAAT
jgi:hypothetical protein